MDTLFGITLERLSHPVGKEELKRHFENFESSSNKNYGFEQYDSLYDRRLDELKFALFHRYNNTLQNLIVGNKMLDGIYRIIFIGELEKIKDFHKMQSNIDYLNRTPKIDKDLYAYRNKVYRIYREKNNTIINNLREAWRYTVNKFFKEFDTYEIRNTNFFEAVSNLHTLKGLEYTDFEHQRDEEINAIKSKFLKFLTASDDLRLSLSEILLHNFKIREDFSVVKFRTIENCFSKSFYANIKDLFISKLRMNEDDVKNKILVNDIFMFDYNKNGFKDSFESLIKDKISEILLKKTNYFTLENGEDIYILNKKTCNVAFSYIPGAELGSETNITVKATISYDNGSENDVFHSIIEKDIKDEKVRGLSIKCYKNDKLFKESFNAGFIITDILYVLGVNSFEVLSKIRNCKLEIIFNDNTDISKKGKISFPNLPEIDEEYTVKYDNFLEVVRKLNPSFRYKVEEITE